MQRYQAPPPPVRRTPQRNRRAGRKRQRKGLRIWQIVLLLMLLAAVIFTAVDLKNANGALSFLRSERRRIQDEYHSLVSRHVNRLQENVLIKTCIEHYSAYYEVNPAFVSAIIYRESHYDPMAVSSVGAQGLMQLMPDTVTWMADKLDLNDPNPHDPETNIRMGTRYLNYLSGKFDGQPLYVACSFHAGAGNVESWIEKGYFRDPANPRVEEIPMDDSRDYARKVLESYAIYLEHVYPLGGAASGA